MKTSAILENIEEAAIEEMRFSPYEEEMLREIVMTAENEGRFYPKDPSGAVDYAWKQYKKYKEGDMRDAFKAIRKEAVKQVTQGWKGESVEEGKADKYDLAAKALEGGPGKGIFKAVKEAYEEFDRELSSMQYQQKGLRKAGAGATEAAGLIDKVAVKLLQLGDTATRTGKLIRRKMAEETDLDFEGMLTEASDRSFADFEKKAISDFFRRAIPQIKKIAGPRAEKVEVIGTTVPMLKYKGQDKSDIDLEVTMSLVPLRDSRVELMDWVDSAKTGKKQSSINTKTGLMKVSTVVQTFENAFGR